MKLPEKARKLLKDEKTVKVLTTVSKEGRLHPIVVGSIMPLDDETLVALEIFMSLTSQNLEDNKDVAILIVNGMESYLIDATVKEHYKKGEFFDRITKPAVEQGMPVKGMWTFDINAVYDQSAAPKANRKIDA